MNIHQFDTMRLTPEEDALLNGARGPVMQKVIQSIALYGEAMGARKLTPITGNPHCLLSYGARMLTPAFDILQELTDAGLKTPRSFTANPRPVDFENMHYSWAEKWLSKFIYGKQARLEEQLQLLGLRDSKAFSCACYLPQVNNIPARGEVLAWSESSAVVYANSVLGARTNRNSGMIELLSTILGKTPFYGLLTDEGRKAQRLIKIRTSDLPDPHLLGSAIGLKTTEDVPLIVGLKALFDAHPEVNPIDYLKDMGASCAASGAVGLYHVEHMTPEAKEYGARILQNNHKVHIIDDKELIQTKTSYPVLWKRADQAPRQCVIGCPHLSLDQVYEWQAKIIGRLKINRQDRVRVDTVLCTAPAVKAEFENDAPAAVELRKAGVGLTTLCPLAHMANPLTASKPIITNSGKLRTYSTARFYENDEILQILTN